MTDSVASGAVTTAAVTLTCFVVRRPEHVRRDVHRDRRCQADADQHRTWSEVNPSGRQRLTTWPALLKLVLYRARSARRH